MAYNTTDDNLQSELVDGDDHLNQTSLSSSSEMPYLFFDEPKNKYWGVSDRDVPILIGAAAGAVGLVLLILGAVLIWYVCQFVFKKEKSVYSLENDDSERGSVSSIGSVIPFSESVLFVGKKMDPDGMAPLNIKRSMSAPMNMRSRSVNPAKSGVDRRQMQSKLYGKMEREPELRELDSIRVNISEEKTGTSSSSSNRAALYTPSIISSMVDDKNHPGLKSSWQMPISEDLRESETSELPQVTISNHFSKTCRNRMRDDSAAAIAISQTGIYRPHHAYQSSSSSYSNLENQAADLQSQNIVVFNQRTVL